MGDWDFHHEAVEGKEQDNAAMQIGSKAILIGFGPPNYDHDANVTLTGFIQNLSLNQQKQIREIFEIGSGARFFADGPTRNNLSIGRALFSGASILKMMGTGLTGEGPGGNLSDADINDVFGKGDDARDAVATDFEDAHWLNLGSSFFNNPLGTYLEYGYFDGTGNREVYSKSYLENCKIRSLSTNMQAGQWLTQEQVQVQFANIVPIEGKKLDEDGNSYYDDKEDFLEDMYNVDDADLSHTDGFDLGT